MFIIAKQNALDNKIKKDIYINKYQRLINFIICINIKL